MILSKQYLNELKDKKIVTDSMSLLESKYDSKKQTYDVFFSYSSMNKNFAIMIVQLLEKCGYSVYIDLYDKRLNRDKVDKNTAKILANAMKKCKGLIYLHSSASKVSKWCPWELGYFSGTNNFMCANVPMTEMKNEKYEGQEYLDIYKDIEYSAVKNKSKYDFWVYDKDRYYVTLREWLDGKWDSNKVRNT